eukprot:TRINITY_DN928_c0_g1_i1.p1 TRINITY_DN928_c0_g1~~TRINITY_DN928_c0_g1_i1.p1  ORF type:complete len:865 (-),score=195.77 TRINITY_DN928_c0_g1_i1:11956-14550(-)
MVPLLHSLSNHLAVFGSVAKLRNTTRGAVLLVLFRCLAGAISIADEPAATTNSIERFNLATGGTGLYRPEKWGLIKVSLRNPHDRPVDLMATTHFVDDPSLQFGRRFWIPAKSRLSTWHPIRMPRLQNPEQRMFDLQSMVVSSAGGAETMTTNEQGSMQFEQGILVAANESVTAAILDNSEMIDHGPEWARTYDLLMTARFDRGLRFNLTMLPDPLLPAGEELLDAVDQVVIASDRIKTDAAGISAIRRWVAGGGRLWIMADKVSPELLAAMLGDEDQIAEVDRVDLTSFKMESGMTTQGTRTFEREVERPVQFVRVTADGMDVDFWVNGWPAAFHKAYGDGQIMVTTLASNGWLRPRVSSDPATPSGRNFQTLFTPSAPLSQLSMEFFVPRSPVAIPREMAEEQVRQLIGYSIPSRRMILGILVMFTALILLVGMWLAKLGRLELMGFVIPGLSLISAAILMSTGWNNRSVVSTSTAVLQMVNAVPGTEDVWTTGLAGVFTKESNNRPLSGSEGGWMLPQLTGLEGTTKRLVWTDIDRWRWENYDGKPGLRTIAFQTAGQVEQPLDAATEFNAKGIGGTLALPDGLNPKDAILVTPNGRIGVEISPNGTFTAQADAVLGADQYLAATVLDDEQQRRSKVLAAMFKPHSEQTLAMLPTLLFWTKPWSAGMSLADDPATAGSALVSVPLSWQRPPAGTPITIPSPLLSFREVFGPDGAGPTGIYNYRTQKWSERSGPAGGWLAFAVPPHLLPLDVKSASITFKVLGPLERLELSSVDGLARKSLKVWDSPVGTLTYEIRDPAVLKLDDRGRLLVRIDIGTRPTGGEVLTLQNSPPDKKSSDPVTYWQIEEATLQMSAEVPSAPSQ